LTTHTNHSIDPFQQTKEKVMTDPTAIARVRAAGLFAAAARQDTLTATARLRCFEAADILAVTTADLEAADAAIDHPYTSTPEMQTPEEEIREGLRILGVLDIELFADCRIRSATRHARRALRHAHSQPVH
jgi:hypothetical protein